MKVRVMVVEDEPMIRRGIIQVLPWNELDCEIVAEAENGMDGLEKARQFEPGLVISDIKMPKMDGLTMIEKLKKQNPQMEVILLTGFQEFEYAKKAIMYGVSDYVLKPVDQEELIQIVGKLVGRIQAAAARQDEWKLLQEKVRESQPILKEKFLHNLLFYSPGTIYHIYEKMDYFNIKINNFFVLEAAVDSFHELERGFTEKDIQILLFLIEEQAEELLELYGFSAVTFQHEKAVYIIVSGGGENLGQEMMSEYGRQLEEQVGKRGGFTVSVGISNPHTGAQQVRTARMEADQCIAQSWYLGTGSVICYCDFREQAAQEVPVWEMDADEYYTCVKQGNSVMEKVEIICRQIEGVENISLIRSCVTEIVSRSFRILIEEYGENEDILEQMEQMLEQAYYAKRRQNCERILRETGRWIEQWIQERQQSRTRYIIDEAIQYMRENCRREISLEEVADHLYISKWYFSKLFHKEKGVKFSDYAGMLRIEEAQRIIRENPKLKNYEVADMMGFGNVRYFSQLFKKVTGRTPSEYRG